MPTYSVKRQKAALRYWKFSNPLVMQSNYKRLGDYIRQVDVRNRDLAVDNLVGLTIEKAFIPSVANTIGTDLSNYKVISNGQFACSLMQVSRDGKMPIAMFKGEKGIMSPAYPMFEVYRKDELLPEFLMMWFSRKEFDREVTFWAVGGVRGSLTWEDFENLNIPVPSIEKQRKIVAEYQAVEQRIENNRRLIATLESTAQTIYRQMFVDNIDPENLPQGWRMGTIGDIISISSGKSLSDKVDEPNNEYKYPVAGASGIIGYAREANQDEKFLTTGRVGTIGVVNRYLTTAWTADNVLVAKSKHYEYAYQVLRGVNYQELIGGGVQNLITQTGLSNIELPIPPSEEINEFERRIKDISNLSTTLDKENDTMLEVLYLLLTKLSTI